MSDSPKPASPVNILDSYCKSMPSDQNAMDIFEGEWASKFPPPYQHLKAGGVPLFQDDRMSWALSELGGCRGQNVLELGPLEGGHSFIFERAGAASVTAIESNTRAYLKCLVTKEILNLARVRFLCGDFTPYLQSSKQHYDLLVACGVLYHMKDPLQLLKLIADHTDRTIIWTHYYDAQIINSKPYLKCKFPSEQSVSVGGQTLSLHRQEYLAALSEKSFCGGTESYSTWLTRDGLLHALRTYGFTDFKFSHETPDHPNGPALILVATKS